MPAPQDPRYFPIVKGKPGEFRALAELGSADKDLLRLVIDVPPEKVKFSYKEVTVDGQVEKRKEIEIETVAEALDGYAESIQKVWGSADECLVDLAGFDPSLRLPGDVHPVTAFFDDARKVGLAAIPVTGPDRDAAQVAAVASVCGGWPTLGAAIRVRRPDLEDVDSLASKLSALLGQLSLDPAQVDLLLDFGELKPSRLDSTSEAALAVLTKLPSIDSWRSLSIAAGAFPFELSDVVDSRKTEELDRLDWKLWQRIVGAENELPRLPSYGDYLATNAEWKEPFDPMFSVGAKIVYATDAGWIVLKGSVISKKNGRQYFELATDLTKHNGYLGNGHCGGDARIAEASREEGGAGSPSTWIGVATRHHLQVASRQLASPA